MVKKIYLESNRSSVQPGGNKASCLLPVTHNWFLDRNRKGVFYKAKVVVLLSAESQPKSGLGHQSIISFPSCPLMSESEAVSNENWAYFIFANVQQNVIFFERYINLLISVNCYTYYYNKTIALTLDWIKGQDVHQWIIDHSSLHSKIISSKFVSL